MEEEVLTLTADMIKAYVKVFTLSVCDKHIWNTLNFDLYVHV